MYCIWIVPNSQYTSSLGSIQFVGFCDIFSFHELSNIWNLAYSGKPTLFIHSVDRANMKSQHTWMYYLWSSIWLLYTVWVGKIVILVKCRLVVYYRRWCNLVRHISFSRISCLCSGTRYLQIIIKFWHFLVSCFLKFSSIFRYRSD